MRDKLISFKVSDEEKKEMGKKSKELGFKGNVSALIRFLWDKFLSDRKPH